jgi:hypothetical protein
MEGERSDLPKIGYLYHYHNADHPSEKFRLDIYISDTPSEEHFDVLRVILFEDTGKGSTKQTKISHPWKFEGKLHVCPGVIVMEDRKGKKEEAFSFGGVMEILSNDNHTNCTLVSSAPILEISTARPLNTIFIEELEALLAEFRAGSSQEYLLELCKATPDRIYQACLLELSMKLEGFPHQYDQISQLQAYLHTEMHRLQAAGMLQEPIPDLEQLIGDDAYPT